MAAMLETGGGVGGATTDGAVLSAGRLRVLRCLYGFNVAGAGLPGLATLFAPEWAAANLFGAPQDPVALRMLASVWLSVGALSVLGFRRPLRFSAVFPLEALYKSVWLVSISPHLLRGERPEVAPMALLFAAWVAADLVATPWSYLINGRGARAVG